MKALFFVVSVVQYTGVRKNMKQYTAITAEETQKALCYYGALIHAYIKNVRANYWVIKKYPLFSNN